jgi:hypothetical protein
MDKKRLEYYKKKLVTRREELLRGIARTEQEGREADEDPTVDLADKAANSYTKEFLFGQTHNDRSLLQLVDDALARIRMARSVNAFPATRSFSRSAWKRCRGRGTASPARKKWNKDCSRPSLSSSAVVHAPGTGVPRCPPEAIRGAGGSPRIHAGGRSASALREKLRA